MWRYVTQLPQGRNAARVSDLCRVRGSFSFSSDALLVSFCAIGLYTVFNSRGFYSLAFCLADSCTCYASFDAQKWHNTWHIGCAYRLHTWTQVSITLKRHASNFHALVTYTTPLSPKNQFAVLFIAVISYEWYSQMGFYFRVVKALPRNANW